MLDARLCPSLFSLFSLFSLLSFVVPLLSLAALPPLFLFLSLVHHRAARTMRNHPQHRCHRQCAITPNTAATAATRYATRPQLNSTAADI